jgi:hypothetical protein
MNSFITRTSLSDAVYFSFASFLIFWLASFLFDFLQKTPGRLSMGAMLVIIMGLMLIIFVLAITNIVLSEPDIGKVNLSDRIFGIFLFIITSTAILGILALAFWFQF